ncbi:hypothetical protein UT5_05430 [Ferrigenium sp. UT5]
MVPVMPGAHTSGLPGAAFTAWMVRVETLSARWLGADTSKAEFADVKVHVPHEQLVAATGAGVLVASSVTLPTVVT